MLSAWTPAPLLRNAVYCDLKEFVSLCGAAYVLCVDDPRGELATSGFGRGKAGQFVTEVSEHASLEPESTRTRTPSDLKRAGSPTTHSGTGGMAALPLPPQLLAARCHVVPLRGFETGEEGASLTIGRSPKCEVPLPQPGVSKRHARLEVRGGGMFVLEDLDSTNHTYVNGSRLVLPVEVHPGCCLRFGSLETHLYRTRSLYEALRTQAAAHLPT